MEQHPPTGMTGPSLMAFRKGLEDVVLSAGLWTMSDEGAAQVVDLIVLLLPWVVVVGFYWFFYIVDFFNVVHHSESPGCLLVDHINLWNK